MRSATARTSNCCWQPRRQSRKQILREQPLDCHITHVGELVPEMALATRCHRHAYENRTDRMGAFVGQPFQADESSDVSLERLTYKMFTFIANNEHDTDRFGAAMAGVLPPGTVLALIGTLGAGKTRLVQAVAEALGVPPWTGHQPHVCARQRIQGGRLPVYHFDTYRLKDDRRVSGSGTGGVFRLRAASCSSSGPIAWPNCCRTSAWKSRIEVTGPTTRRITVAGTAPQTNERSRPQFKPLAA